MLSKRWTYARNIVFSIVGLIVILVLAFIAVNIKDQSPSATALEFQRSLQNRTPVDVADNGYIYLLGFDAAKDLDPNIVGQTRIKWSNEVIRPATGEFLSFPDAHYSFEKELSKKFKKIIDACVQIGSDCMSGIHNNRELIQQSSQEIAWKVDRYLQLISYPAWLELAKVDIHLPLPSFGDVMKTQRLSFVHSFATENNKTIVELLDRDLRFWRTVLKNTDMLIAKMIAVAAIKNNFSWTNYYFLGLDVDNKSEFLPTKLMQPFTNEELSMRRCLIGEWFFYAGAIDQPNAIDIDNITGKLLFMLSYQKQDTINMLVESLHNMQQEIDVPLADFEDALTQYSYLTPPQKTIIYYLTHPYNIVGNILKDLAPPSMYVNYVARSKDLETFRRGLLFSIEKMDVAINAQSQHVSSYHSKPFMVDQTKKSVTVTGLSNDDKSQQIYFY